MGDKWVSVNERLPEIEQGGEPWGMVGWCHKGMHPDFDDYYQSADLTVTDWQPVVYPEAPTL